MTKRAKLFVLLGLLTFALFNYPFLTIFNRNLCWIEIPVLVYYLFGAWLLAILILLAGRRFLSS